MNICWYRSWGDNDDSQNSNSTNKWLLIEQLGCIKTLQMPHIYCFQALDQLLYSLSAVLLILDKCNLYISQNTKFVKNKGYEKSNITEHPLKDIITFVYFTEKPHVFPSETSILIPISLFCLFLHLILTLLSYPLHWDVWDYSEMDPSRR